MTINTGNWEQFGSHAATIRQQVFVVEQKVPADIELDAFDASSVHAVAYDEAGNPVGTGRLLPDGHIGRMAVLKAWRGRGVGSRLLNALIQEARQRRYREVVLSSQKHAMPFYARHGFKAEGASYMEAGIEHIFMRLPLER